MERQFENVLFSLEEEIRNQTGENEVCVLRKILSLQREGGLTTKVGSPR